MRDLLGLQDRLSLLPDPLANELFAQNRIQRLLLTPLHPHNQLVSHVSGGEGKD